jgi:formylmethanofuran dehydrogenase subunit E
MGERSIPHGIPTIEETIRFHGHLCPGLAIGYRAAVAAMRVLQVDRPRDEELVAIAEGDACDLDAIQAVTGCTYGKGNLIVNHIGKHAFTFVRRDSADAVRVVLRYPENLQDSAFSDLRFRVFSGTASISEKDRFRKGMVSLSRTILAMREEEILQIAKTSVSVPRKARIYRSVTCSQCGEQCAEPMSRLREGKILCLSCFAKGE